MTRRTRIVIGGLLLGWTFSLHLTALAAVPRLIRYQGQVADSQSVPLEGPYTLTFRLYDAATQGATLWEEVQPNIVLTNGRFTVLLGQVTPMTTVDWSKSLWLSTQVGAEPELAPRQPITSVPLAMRAEVAERLAAPTDIGARVFNTLLTSIPNETDVSLSFNTERWDTDAIHNPDLSDPSARPTRLTCRTAGTYLMFGHISFAPNATGRRYIAIRANGGQDLALQSTAALPMGSTVLSVVTVTTLAVNDYVELYVRQGSGGPLDVQPSGGSGAASDFGMVKLN